MEDKKYVVFKLEEWDTFQVDPTKITLQSVDDAIVIRRQDMFAPPALDAYANSITTTLEGMKGVVALLGEHPLVENVQETITRLAGIADYFHEQAVTAWETERKLPD